MPDRLNTLHIEMGRHLYGGALQVLYLMKGLVQRGHQASLICATGSSIETESRRAGITVYPIPAVGDFDVRVASRSYSIIKRVRPDIVHLHSRRGADFFGGIAARMAKAPAIVLSRRVDDPVSLNIVGRIKYGFIPDRIVAISDGIRQILRDGGVRNGKTELVHSGVVPSDFQNTRDRAWLKSEFGIALDAPVIGTIAQLIDRKGHRYLFSIIPEIRKDFPNVHYLMLGEGPARAELEHIVQSLGIQDVVTFTGFRSDIKRILPNLDIVVHPATREGLGVCLLQASAAGLPIVAAGVGGIPEIVKNERTGLLIPPADEDAILQSVLRLLRDPSLAARLGENARRHVETDFSVDQMVEGNIRVYFDTLGKVSDGRCRNEAR